MKKIIICLLFILVMSCSTVFGGGFGVGLFVPVSGTMSRFETKFKDGSSMKNIKDRKNINWEIGALVQPGYIWGFNNIAGFAFLLDLGYYRDKFSFSYNVPNTGITSKETYVFDSFNVGLYPKFNIAFLSIGVGGGVKLPMAITRYIESPLGSPQSVDKFKYNDIKNIFNNAYIPYLKVSLDFLIKVNSNFAFVLGLYANYDFPMQYKLNTIEKITIDKKSISAFDIGVQVGMYIVGS